MTTKARLTGVARAGPSPSEAAAAMVLLHGRGATAADILALAEELPLPQLAYLAPQAEGNSWYPYSFLAPLEANEPALSRSLRQVHQTIGMLVADGVPLARQILLGFSQGACLALEYAARNARRWGGVVGLTGGLIGPPGTPRAYGGSLDGTPVFLGAGDPDPHVPWSRVEETAEVLRGLGGRITLRRYPGMAHAVNSDELATVRRLAESVLPKSDQTNR